MKRHLLVLLSIIGLTAATLAQKETILNGKTYSVTLTQTKGKTGQRKWKWDTDELSFKGGKVTSKTMKTYEQYPTTVYSSKIDSSSGEKKISFKMLSHSPYHVTATIELDGTVDGNNIEGTAVWVSVIGTYNYSFSGTLKP